MRRGEIRTVRTGFGDPLVGDRRFHRTPACEEPVMWNVFEDDPPRDWWAKWVLGAAVPGLIALVGARCIVTGYAWLPSRRMLRQPLELQGAGAAWVGVALLAAALFLHIHYLWNNVDRLTPFTDVAKTASLLAFFAALGVVLWRIVVVL
jgi:hypothetical protein